MKIQSVKALTMVELLVTLVISSVLILMVGFLSQIAFSSHAQLIKENDVYSDLFYGLSRLTFLARKANALTPDHTWTNPWVSDMLVVRDGGVDSAFGLYRYSKGGIYYRDFVFVPDITNPHISDPDITAYPEVRQPLLTETDDTTSVTVNQNGKSVTLKIDGVKDKEYFTVSNFVVMWRN